MLKSAINDYNIPEEFICSMSQRIMVDPVTISNGSTFDRSSITQMHRLGWSTPICLKTGVPFNMFNFIPNRNLKDAIECEIKYLEKNIKSLSRYNLVLYMDYVETKTHEQERLNFIKIHQEQKRVNRAYHQSKLERKNIKLLSHDKVMQIAEKYKCSYETIQIIKQSIEAQLK